MSKHTGTRLPRGRWFFLAYSRDASAKKIEVYIDDELFYTAYPMSNLPIVARGITLGND